ncbi:MAG: PadR family transcriptional regulator [Longimicrobiales bacterium]
MTERRSLAEFEFYVLLAVARLGEDAYGVPIRREIETRGGRKVSMGAIYATLARLEEKGLVEFRYSEPLPVRGGRSRKLVSLTRSGRVALAGSATGLQRMMKGLDLSHEAGGAR